MKSKATPRAGVVTRNVRTLLRALLLSCLAVNRHARAQAVLAPAPAAPDLTPTAVQQVNEMDVFATPPQTESQPFQWGPLTFRPHPSYQFLYADGILVNAGQSVHTIIQNISPGALLEIGRHWTLDYAPDFSFYSSDRFSDTFGQAVKLTGGTIYNDWALGLVAGYTETDLPSAVTASQTRQDSTSAAFTGSYTINSKLSLDLSLNQNYVAADKFSSYDEWSTLDWLNYQFWPRLNAALGVGVGYDNMRTPPDMTFEQAQGRINWRVTDRIGFQLHGGVETRQFLSGSAGDIVNPVFDVTVQYRPFEMTHVSLTAQRVVSASYLTTNQVTETTVISAGLNQRMPENFFLDLNGGYEAVKYVSSPNTSGANRRDNYYFLNLQLGRTFLRRGTAAVIYQLSRNDSSFAGYSFTSHQVGFQIGYSF